MVRFLFILILIASLAACKSTKNIQTAITKKDTASVVITGADARADSLRFIQNTLNQIEKNHIDFTTFSAKINVDYQDAGNRTYNLNAFVRMQKDSAIWISINAILGIEVMRALITTDSVKLLDKQNKVYTQRSINYLQEVTRLPLDLSTLQNLIIGNPVFLDSSNIVSYTKTGNTISLLSIGKWFKNLITVNESDKTVLHSKLDDVDVARNRTADLTYTDYDSKEGEAFSTKRIITVAEKNKLDITLDFKQYDLNKEISFPFSVPKNYTTR